MNFLKKLCLLFIASIIVFTNAQNGFCITKIVKKDIEVQTKDNHIIKATLTYPKIKDKKKYSTVVLLHSLGYTSESWGPLITDLNLAGYAVLAVDLRGHGKSVYNTNLKQRSWVYFTQKTFKKYPADIVEVLKQTQSQTKKVSLDNIAFIGADIGANTAILASKELPKKPKAMVLISASTSFKGLYIPITLTEIGTIPILSMASAQDEYSLQEQRKISKFAQGAFYAKNYPKGGMGMMMIKTNPQMSKDIIKWLLAVFK